MSKAFPRCRHHVNPLAVTKEVSFDGFENKNPIIMDIGAYKGEFVEEMAMQFPEKNIIACELRKPIADALTEKFADYDNVVVCDGDAQKNFFHIVMPSIQKGVLLERVYVNFPDPWFKKSHHKRRFLSKKFLDSIEPWFPENTEIVFQTDQEFLFKETQEMLLETGFEVVKVLHNSPFGIQTHWEKEKQKCAKPIFRCIIQKKNNTKS